MTPLRGQSLQLSQVGHVFGATVALDNVNLAVAAGELIALLGPSGCGKTTMLQIIAGFLKPTTGEVRFADARVEHIPANRRRIGMVFQNYALFPHLTVFENVAYGLRARKLRGSAVTAKVSEMLALVQMSGFARRLPGQLSGGQQQRVALARALAIEPGIVLLDEPFSALDKNLRLDMQIEIKSLLKSYGVTSIIVTHDQEEALSMADRIVVLNRGHIEQIDTPDALYDRPMSLFVNSFIGHTNFLRGVVTGSDSVKLEAGPEITLARPTQRISRYCRDDLGAAGEFCAGRARKPGRDRRHRSGDDAARRLRRDRVRHRGRRADQDQPAAIVAGAQGRGRRADQPGHIGYRCRQLFQQPRNSSFTQPRSHAMSLSRRSLLKIGSTALAAGTVGLPQRSHAAGSIVATTYPGSFDEAFRAVVGPAFTKASGTDVTFTPLLGVDQIGKIQASPNAPPFDVVLFDEGPLIPAIATGVLEKFPSEKSKSFADIPEAFRHPGGYAPVVTVQLIGIAYNPKKITTPPTSWEDLWKPEYKGRVGITGLASSLGTAFMVEIAKLHGGSETNIEPAFEAVKKLLAECRRHCRVARCLGRAVPAGRNRHRVQLLEQRRAVGSQGRRHRLRQAEIRRGGGALQRPDRQEQPEPAGGAGLSRHRHGRGRAERARGRALGHDAHQQAGAADRRQPDRRQERRRPRRQQRHPGLDQIPVAARRMDHPVQQGGQNLTGTSRV